MVYYLELIRKQKELIKKIEQKSEKFNEKLLELEQEKKTIDCEMALEYIKLNQLQRLEEEMNLSNLVLAFLIIFFFLSVLAYPILVSFGFSSFSSLFAVAGVNVGNGIFCFLLSRVKGRKIRKEKRNNQGKINDTLSFISDLNLKRYGINQEYHFIKKEIHELQILQEQEKKDLKEMSQAVIDSLVEQDSFSINLDQMVEEKISHEKQIEFDMNVKRVLSYLEK